MTNIIINLRDCKVSANVSGLAYTHLSSFRQWLESYLEQRREALREDEIIPYGWCPIRLRKCAGVLHLQEPDFDKDPLNHWRSELSTSLIVREQQAEVFRKIDLFDDLREVPSMFNQKVTAVNGVFGSKRIFLSRTAVDDPLDSGWHCGNLDDDSEDDQLEAIYAYQLLKIRPSLLQAMSLPQNFLIVFEGDQIQDVVNDEDQSVWKITSK